MRVSEPGSTGLTRRGVLRLGLGGLATLVGGGALGLELVDRGVLPGRTLLDRLDGACDVPVGDVSYGRPGPQYSGWFASRARGRRVGYTIAYPPGHGPGSRLPLIVALHGYLGDHTNALAGGSSPARTLALRLGGIPLAPVAVVTVDGGDGYWHRHGTDDPLGMLVDELIPRCRRAGLGRPPQRVGVVGISMGGYGALLLAEQNPRMIRAVAAISPAIWTSYDQARTANAGAFSSAADFAAHDVVGHASRLRGVAVRVAAGRDDPFYPAVRTLVRALPAGAGVELSGGCHTGAFFAAQEGPSLAFLAAQLTHPG
jgi:enterochelin esterase-like enzyme